MKKLNLTVRSMPSGRQFSADLDTLDFSYLLSPNTPFGINVARTPRKTVDALQISKNKKMINSLSKGLYALMSEKSKKTKIKLMDSIKEQVQTFDMNSLSDEEHQLFEQHHQLSKLNLVWPEIYHILLKIKYSDFIAAFKDFVLSEFDLGETIEKQNLLFDRYLSMREEQPNDALMLKNELIALNSVRRAKHAAVLIRQMESIDAIVERRGLIRRFVKAASTKLGKNYNSWTMLRIRNAVKEKLRSVAEITGETLISIKNKIDLDILIGPAIFGAFFSLAGFGVYKISAYESWRKLPQYQKEFYKSLHDSKLSGFVNVDLKGNIKIYNQTIETNDPVTAILFVDKLKNILSDEDTVTGALGKLSMNSDGLLELDGKTLFKNNSSESQKLSRLLYIKTKVALQEYIKEGQARHEKELAEQNQKQKEAEAKAQKEREVQAEKEAKVREAQAKAHEAQTKAFEAEKPFNQFGSLKEVENLIKTDSKGKLIVFEEELSFSAENAIVISEIRAELVSALFNANHASAFADQIYLTGNGYYIMFPDGKHYYVGSKLNKDRAKDLIRFVSENLRKYVAKKKEKAETVVVRNL